LTGLLEGALASGRRVHPHDAGVAPVWIAPCEPVLLEAAHDAGHRRWAHLLGRGQLAEGLRAAEDEDGEGGEPRRRQAARGVFSPRVAERMDRGGVEPIGCA